MRDKRTPKDICGEANHYPDLVSSSDLSCRLGNLIQPIRSTTQIIMKFLCSFLRHHLAGKPVVALPNVTCFLRLRNFIPNRIDKLFNMISISLSCNAYRDDKSISRSTYNVTVCLNIKLIVFS